jgi:5,10-methylenetetrahydromethanopterin reductase
LHYAYEQVTQFGHEPPAHLDAIWDDYVTLVEAEPLERRHLCVHQGHNCWVVPDEERFVTPDLIAASCLVGTPDELVERVRALDDAGLDQLVLLPPLDEEEAVIATVARHVLPAFA